MIMQMASELISIVKLETQMSPRGLIFTFKRRFIFLVSRRNIELKASKHELTDKSHQNKQGFEGEKLSGMVFTVFPQNVCQTMAYSVNLKQRFLLFSPRFSCLFCLLFSRILQNNLLDLCLVKIRRYKLSFFTKPATKFLLTGPPFLQDLKKWLREARNSLEAGTRHIIG